MRRAVVLGVSGLVAVCSLAGPAWGHATLRRTTPGFQQELHSAPRVVRLHFDQSVQLPTINVLDIAGHNRALPARATTNDVLARVEPLKRGVYTIRWRAVSADSHVVSGVFTFGVREPAPPPTEAVGASGPTHTEHVVRWLYFLSFALLIGSLGFRLLLLRGLPLSKRLDGRLYLLSGIGVAAVLEVGILAFCLRAEDALQLPFADFLYGDLSPLSGGTRFGQAFVVMTLGYALVAALVFLAWLTDRPRPFLAPALLLSIGFASGLSLSGHDGVDPGSSWKSQLADWVHLSAASLWIGGLVTLLAVIWPAAPELRREAFLRFSRLATVLVALVVSAGVYLSIVRLPHLSDLWTASYGRVLLVKLSLVSVALLWGAVHHFVVRPALSRASDGFMTRVGRSLIGEGLVGAAVLLAAAVLVDSKPPARPAEAPPAQAVAK